MTTITFIVRQSNGSREFSDVDSVNVPTSQGFIQILPGHAPLIAETAPGTCVISSRNESQSLPLSSAGLMRVKENKIILVL